MTRDGGAVLGAALVVVKAGHTVIWFGVEACLIYLVCAGLTGRTDRRAALAGAVVGGEVLVFLGNGARCPLTELARSLGAEHGSVTDIYLPRWFAHNLPVIHVPVVALVGYLHVRNVRRRRRHGAGTES